MSTTYVAITTTRCYVADAKPRVVRVITCASRILARQKAREFRRMARRMALRNVKLGIFVTFDTAYVSASPVEVHEDFNY